MDKNVMMEQITMMNINFSLKMDVREMQAYCRMLYPKLVEKGVTDDMFVSAVDTFMDKTEGNNFNKLPSRGDFLAILGMTPKTIEQIAEEQAQECISKAPRMRHWHFVQYDDPVTNWVLQNAFGGVSAFAWSIADDNENKKDSVWVKKRFVDEYLTAHRGGKKHFGVLRNQSATFISNDRILKIGNESICDQNRLLDVQKKSSALDVVKSISNNMNINKGNEEDE